MSPSATTVRTPSNYLRKYISHILRRRNHRYIFYLSHSPRPEQNWIKNGRYFCWGVWRKWSLLQGLYAQNPIQLLCEIKYCEPWRKTRSQIVSIKKKERRIRQLIHIYIYISCVRHGGIFMRKGERIKEKNKMLMSGWTKRVWTMKRMKSKNKYNNFFSDSQITVRVCARERERVV